MRKIIIDNEFSDRNVYCRKIKSIIFAMVYIRLNIYFALAKLSAYISNLKTYYNIAVKYILRYLKSTTLLYFNYGLTRASGKRKRIKVFTSLDFAINKNDRRLILEYIVILNKKAIF